MMMFSERCLTNDLVDVKRRQRENKIQVETLLAEFVCDGGIIDELPPETQSELDRLNAIGFHLYETRLAIETMLDTYARNPIPTN